MPKQRPAINFTVPQVHTQQPTESAEALELHNQKVTALLNYDAQGFSWRDAYFLAFGYNGIQPFQAFMEFAPNSVSSLTGKPVVTEEDFLDVVYAQFELEQREQQMLESLPEGPKQGRPRLPEEVRLARSAEARQKQDKAARLKAARDQLDSARKDLWKRYQDALLAKREAEAYHSKLCSDLLREYQQLKGVTVDPDDYN